MATPVAGRLTDSGKWVNNALPTGALGAVIAASTAPVASIVTNVPLKLAASAATAASRRWGLRASVVRGGKSWVFDILFRCRCGPCTIAVDCHTRVTRVQHSPLTQRRQFPRHGATTRLGRVRVRCAVRRAPRRRARGSGEAPCSGSRMRSVQHSRCGSWWMRYGWRRRSRCWGCTRCRRLDERFLHIPVWQWSGSKGLRIAVHDIANTLPVAASVTTAVKIGTKMVATEVATMSTRTSIITAWAIVEVATTPT